MPLDLIIRNARLSGGSAEPTDIGISGGRIAAIERNIRGEAKIYAD